MTVHSTIVDISSLCSILGDIQTHSALVDIARAIKKNCDNLIRISEQSQKEPEKKDQTYTSGIMWSGVARLFPEACESLYQWCQLYCNNGNYAEDFGKIALIKRLRTTGEDYGYKIGLKDAKDIIESPHFCGFVKVNHN